MCSASCGSLKRNQRKGELVRIDEIAQVERELDAVLELVQEPDQRQEAGDAKEEPMRERDWISTTEEINEADRTEQGMEDEAWDEDEVFTETAVSSEGGQKKRRDFAVLRPGDSHCMLSEEAESQR